MHKNGLRVATPNPMANGSYMYIMYINMHVHVLHVEAEAEAQDISTSERVLSSSRLAQGKE